MMTLWQMKTMGLFTCANGDVILVKGRFIMKIKRFEKQKIIIEWSFEIKGDIISLSLNKWVMPIGVSFS